TLTLAAVALAIPTVFHVAAAGRAGGWSQATEHKLSLAIAVVLFVTYACLLGFELITHKQLYIGDPQGDGEDREEARGWSASRSLFVLIVATCLVALMSEFLVGAVEAARAALGLTEVFVGVIVIAVIGNAAEHSTAVLMAMKNKMGLSLNIAIGSSLQIALFVAPVLVFASYAVASRPMDLLFISLEIISIAVSVGGVALIAQDGESNWMEGVLLLAVYTILGLTFYFLPAT